MFLPMPEYSNELIRTLIECPKKVVRAPKKIMYAERGSSHNDMRLRSDANEDEFDVFVRVNLTFPENFSIGLRHCPPDGGGETLLRYNGPHGLYKARTDGSLHNTAPHIHRASEENIRAGLQAERGAEKTDEYSVAYELALSCFLVRVNAKDAVSYFPELGQKTGSLPFNLDEETVS